MNAVAGVCGRAIAAVVRRLWAVCVVVFEVMSALISFNTGLASDDARRRMTHARAYDEWKSNARVLDKADGYGSWRVDEESTQYDFDEVARRIRQLYALRRSNDVRGMMQALQTDFHRNMCGITNPRLYEYRTGTKSAIRTYVHLVVYLCQHLAADNTVPVAPKRNLLSDIARSYGHCALMLNSSAALGGYHLGVVKALHDAKLLPRIIFGRSTGALVGALVCCRTNIDDIMSLEEADFSAFAARGRGGLGRKLKRLFAQGTLMDVDVLLQFAKDNIGELTFLEAYRLTGRVLNIHVGRYLPASKRTATWLLNYLTAPDVLVYSAAVASCACRGLYAPVDILEKSIDGRVTVCNPATMRWTADLKSFHINRALERIRGLFNVSMFIVSEATLTNLPFLRLGHRRDLCSRVVHFVTEECWRGLAALSRFPMLRGSVTGSLQTIGEPVSGDVVIRPVQGVSDVLKLLTNPDQAGINHCIYRGQQALWPHLEHIRTHVAIEQALYDVVTELSAGRSTKEAQAEDLLALEHYEF
jgi:hypothetical protein